MWMPNKTHAPDERVDPLMFAPSGWRASDANSFLIYDQSRSWNQHRLRTRLVLNERRARRLKHLAIAGVIVSYIVVAVVTYLWAVHQQ